MADRNNAPRTEDDEVGPEPIFQAVAGFYTTNYLAAANAIGLFEALAEGPMDLESVARATGAGAYRTRLVADAMVATGFLTKEDGAYRNTQTAQIFLSGATPRDMRPFITMWERVTLPRWGRFAQVVRTGEIAPMDLDEEEQRIFSEGVEVLTAPTAHALAQAYDWSDHEHLLDVGGGTGSILATILDHNEHLDGTLFELPSVAPMARARLSPLKERVEVVEGDVFEDALPNGHDALLMANVVHLWQPEKNQEVLARIAKVVEPGARLLLADFWTGPDKVEPPIAALTAGDFLLATGEGDVYSVDEAQGWLEEAGFRFVEHQPLAGPQSLIVAEAE